MGPGRLPRQRDPLLGRAGSLDLFDVPEPRTGGRFAISQAADTTYKRLSRTFDVPAGGGELSFWVTRDTESNWDYFFVEAHVVDSDAWTTLPDLEGNTSDDTGFACPYWLFGLHPFLTHYQTDNGDGTCNPNGTSEGQWWAASGASAGYERWRVDLTPYAGERVEVSLSYASDDFYQQGGVYVDDVTWSGGAGSTSFEDDGDTFDGWTVPGAPAGSSPNANDWIVGTAADAPASIGDLARGALARQPEDPGLPRWPVRRLPVLRCGRDRRRHRPDRLRPGEPDPPDLRQGVLRQPNW